jgi:outer membrane protein
VIQNRAPLLPQLSATAAYQNKTANAPPPLGILPPGMMMRAVTNTFDTFNYYSFGASLNQLVWDFGTAWHRFRASEALARSQGATEKSTVLSIESQVRTTYFSARAQKALVQVAQETLSNQERHLQQIEGFVRVGSRPEIDLAQARTDRANAQVQLITAENGYETAKAQLNLAMGVDASPDYDVADETLPAVDGEDATTESLLGEALKTRPEVAALAEQVAAQKLALRGAKGAYGPSFFVGTGGTAAGTEITDMAYNWNFTASMSWTIFNGLANWGVVKEAAASLVALEAQLNAQRQQVRLDLEQARLAVRAAKAALMAAEEAATNARERLRLAEGRYQAGVGNIIELGDAQVAMTNAAAQRVQAEYTLSSARAQLLRALGRK